MSNSSSLPSEQAAIEAGFAKYLTSLQKIIVTSLGSIDDTTTKLVTTLYSEIERGGKELVVYRELFLYMSNNSLTQEKWYSISGRLEQLRKERETTTAATEKKE